MSVADEVQVSVVMPCLNEEATIGGCIQAAQDALRRLGVSGEIIVADNGSTDRSAEISRMLGARIVYVGPQGYGYAYQGGINAARGRVIVIGDSDATYDFSRIDELLRPLENGADLVLGSRLRGTIERGAMPWLHRYVGNPTLSRLLNFLYRTRISDTHTGLRAFPRFVYDRLNLRSGGMEFASEMLIAAARERLSVVEVPVTYRPRAGESKLRTFNDGWRHLRLLLVYSPTYLFTLPGAVMVAGGMALLIALLPGPLTVFGRMLDYHFMFVGSLAAILGAQLLMLGLFARSYRAAPSWFTLERGLIAGLLLMLIGLGTNLVILVRWIQSGFGPLHAVRPAIFALTLIVIGAQMLFSSFFLDFQKRERPDDSIRE